MLQKDKDTASRDALSEIEPRRVCLIVPEQQAVIWETRLAKSVPPESALVLDVVSFTRLANLVKRRFGGSFLQQRRTGGSRSADVEGYRIGRAASARIRQ